MESISSMSFVNHLIPAVISQVFDKDSKNCHVSPATSRQVFAGSPVIQGKAWKSPGQGQDPCKQVIDSICISCFEERKRKYREIKDPHIDLTVKGTSHYSIFQFSLFSTLADIFAV